MTSTVADACGPVVQVRLVPAGFTWTPAHATPPIETLAPVRFVPVIVTTVPPVVGPLIGVIADVLLGEEMVGPVTVAFNVPVIEGDVVSAAVTVCDPAVMKLKMKAKAPPSPGA